MQNQDIADERFGQEDFARLAACINAVGTERFPELICQLCMEFVGAEKVYLTAFFDRDPIVELYSNHSSERHLKALEMYLKVAYFLDPFFQRFREHRGDELLLLGDIAPDNFKTSEYYQLFYRDMGLQDECGILVHIGENSAICISMGAEETGHGTNPRRLSSALPAIYALIKRHWTRLTPVQTDGTGRLAAQLEAAFKAFGKSVLSPRESEIVRLILQGHSSKSIAREFDNSPETIKVHRRRVYQKLNIASQGELLSLFLSAVMAAPPTSSEDPLYHYFASKTSTPG